MEKSAEEEARGRIGWGKDSHRENATELFPHFILFTLPIEVFFCHQAAFLTLLFQNKKGGMQCIEKQTATK